MEIEFDFKEEQSRLFGAILRPVARVVLVNESIEVPQHLYVDSGADITLIPRSVGELLGFLVFQEDLVWDIKGIGKGGVPIIIKKIKMKVGERLLDIRVAWALIEEVPLLLGRADVFNMFDVCFNKNKKTVFRD